MLESTPRNVMIDPSLIVSDPTFHTTFSLVNELQDSRLKFYLPESVRGPLLANELDETSPVFRFFLLSARPSAIQELSSLVKDYSNQVIGFEVSEQYARKHKAMYSALRETAYRNEDFFDSNVLDALFEEWVFLNEYSWIVSRIKKSFNKFIDAGAVCVQFGKKSVDTIMRKTLKREQNDPISRLDMLRAFGKWVAVGGIPTVSLIDPLAAVFSNIIAGSFLLFDPKPLERH